MKTQKYRLAGLFALLLAACAHNPEVDDLPADSTPAPVQVELHLTAEDATAVTRTIDENTIRDVNLYLFGDTNYRFYFAAVPSYLTFETLPGTYRAYLLTNLHKDLGALSEEELQAYAVPTESLDDDNTLPMTAACTMTVGSSGTASPTAIRVTRCTAKIVYTIEVAPTVTASIRLRSVQFCNLPRTARPFGRDATDSQNPADYYNGEVQIVTSDATTSGVQYLAENRQGTVEAITGQQDKSPNNAPSCATYLCILAQGADKVIEYIVYLGENNTSDFNIRRNTHHTMNLVIRGENEIDNRVLVYDGLYYGTANAVLCNGYQTSLDITPYRTAQLLHYAYTGIYAGAEYEAASAKVVWQGTANLISSLYVRGNTLTVNTNGKKGNAVVAICNTADEVLWSFHIWCTAGDPPRDVRCENYAKAAFYMMDRNLGAFANNPASYVDAAGLVYQWGRKDPFPSTNEDYVYTPTGAGAFITLFPIKEYDKSAAAPFEVLQEQSRRNPATFIKVDYGTMWRAQSPSLWGDPEGFKDEYNTASYAWSSVKSVYDPCPAGYRVANRYTWTGFSKDGATRIGDNNFGNTLTSNKINIVGVWNYGFQVCTNVGSTQGVYLPATQYRKLNGVLSTNTLNAKKNMNIYWNSTAGFEGAYTSGDISTGGGCLIFQSNQIMLSGYSNQSAAYDPGFGFSVRCVRE